MIKPKYNIKAILQLTPNNQPLEVYAWVKTIRNERFISLSDGSTIATLQVVCKEDKIPSHIIQEIQTGASIKVKGLLVSSPAKGQVVELLADKIDIIGKSNPEQYPLQPKQHSLTFLREILHWRPRTQLFHAIFKVRNETAFATHQFFRSKHFLYWQTPILTASDCEGAGELFRATILDLQSLPLTDQKLVDDSKDFFTKAAYLTVSGQLEAELGAMSFGQVYTFGPTFRAENSNTTRHLAEFWMIEPEMCFYDLQDNILLAEEFVVYLIKHVLDNCQDELAFLDNFYKKEQAKLPERQRSTHSLLEMLRMVIDNPFEKITYTEAVDIIQQSSAYKKKKFTYPLEWGMDLQSEHERYLVEKHFQKPVVVTDYPSDIKAFYMRMNEGNKTVAAMDILFPSIGEIVGGSQREERLDILESRMRKVGIDPSKVQWYLDTRCFGTVPHSGFGLGFERMVQFITGMGNIRDVIPFPRYPGGIEF